MSSAMAVRRQVGISAGLSSSGARSFSSAAVAAGFTDVAGLGVAAVLAPGPNGWCLIVTGEASAFLRVGRTFDAHAAAEGPLLALKAGADQTPEVVRAFVEAGAGILEVRPEIPALEDVYLHLVADDPAAAGSHR